MRRTLVVIVLVLFVRSQGWESVDNQERRRGVVEVVVLLTAARRFCCYPCGVIQFG